MHDSTIVVHDHAFNRMTLFLKERAPKDVEDGRTVCGSS